MAPGSSLGAGATTALEPVRLAAVEAARQRLANLAIRTPLVRLDAERLPAEIYLKLECLQPIGSFKLRGAGNAMLARDRSSLADGVYTASAGNMAQGVAWVARQLGIPCDVVVPDSAPQTKLDAIERFGGRIIKVPYDRWWTVITDHHFDGMRGRFIHPVSDSDVMAGNATIGLEIVEDLPDVDTVVVPFGGGGLSCGIASAVKAVKPDTRVLAAEVETAAPLAASLRAGGPRSVHHVPSFVDGIGGKSVLSEMWPLVRRLLPESLVVTLRETADAIRLMIERSRVVAEGAGAVGVAAALAGKAGGGKVVCIVSGGNIDAAKLAVILRGEIP